MNGGRLSNDETFVQGLAELRAQFNAAQLDRDAAERALTRIAMRYPEEAEQIRERWIEGAAPATLEVELSSLEAQHLADSDED